MSDPVTRLNAALEGRYTIDREIGEGGMATVYLAKDLKHNRNVALKVLKPELAAVVGAERFLAEIETTANLQHPHILALFDSGEADTFLFYVMPYIEGETLAERIEREKQLPVDEALYIATAVANALQTAHDAGVIHRDIKPANILLSRGEPLVSDFGIALAVGAAGGNRLTETGLSVGTPYYMSPEQATGDQGIGPASDTYALACVLYEMLVGEPPYLGNTAQAVLGKIIQGIPVSPTTVRKAVPANVDAAIRKALEKLPADRFTGAHDFAKALADPSYRYGESAGSVATSGSVARWKGIALGSAAAAVLAAGWALLGGRSVEAPVMREVVLAEGFPTGAPLGRLAAIAPDGSSMVRIQGTGPTDNRLAVRSRGSLEWTVLLGTEGATEPVYSPDGEWVAYKVGTEILKRPLVGGSTVTLAEDADNDEVGLAWLDDATIVYEQQLGDPNRNPVVRIGEDGGDVLGVVFEEGEGGSGKENVIWVHGLPGSEALLLVSCPGNNCSASSVLRAIDLESGTNRILVADVLRAWYVETGHVVYVRRDGAVFAQPFDLTSLEFEGSGIPLFEGVRVNLNSADLVLGDDGTLIYWEGGEVSLQTSQLVWVDRSGREELVDPGLGPNAFATLNLSPDDSRLAVSIDGDDSEDVWVKELPAGPMTRLTTDPGHTRRPVWSLDAVYVAYITDETGSTEARRVRSDGSSVGEYDMLLQRERQVFEMQFTADGRGMIFREGNANAGEADLGFMDLETAEVNDTLLASQFNERAIALSPDGRWLAYVSDVTGQDEVFVRPFPSTGSGRRQVSTNGGREPMWAHNGRELFYREDERGALMTATYTSDPAFEVVSRESLFDASPYFVGEAGSWHSYDVASDDERFVFMRRGSGEEGDPGRLILVQNWFTELRERLGR